MTSTRLPDNGIPVPSYVVEKQVSYAAYVSTTMIKFMNVLEDGKCHKADEIADVLGVNLRSVYRYASRLRALGFQLKGEAGVGYMGKLPPSYSIVGMHSETGLPAFICVCNNPIKAVQDARNDRALAQLGYHRFWALPVYEDHYAQGNGTSNKRLPRADYKDARKDRNASVKGAGHQQAF